MCVLGLGVMLTGFVLYGPKATARPWHSRTVHIQGTDAVVRKNPYQRRASQVGEIIHE